MAVNSKWDLASVHGINRYIWNITQRELEWSVADYGGLIPIVPAQQQPELNDYTRPYIVYTYTRQPTDSEFFIEKEQILYNIYSPHDEDVRRWLNVMNAYLDREDESAAYVNKFLESNGSEEHKRFNYLNIHIHSSVGAQAAVQEGGRVEGSIILRSMYTYYDPFTGLERKDI